MNAVRDAQARATFMLRRESMAGIILNGLACGLFSRFWVSARAQRRAVKQAVQLADLLLAELSQPPPQSAPPTPSPRH